MADGASSSGALVPAGRVGTPPKRVRQGEDEPPFSAPQSTLVPLMRVPDDFEGLPATCQFTQIDAQGVPVMCAKPFTEVFSARLKLVDGPIVMGPVGVSRMHAF